MARTRQLRKRRQPKRDPDELVTQAIELLSQGANNPARKLLVQALRAEPDHVQALSVLTDLEVMQEDWQAASRTLDRLILADPEGDEPHREQRAFLDEVLEYTLRRRWTVDDLEEITGRHEDAYEQGFSKLAAFYLTKARALAPESGAVAYMQAREAQVQGDFEKAEQGYREAARRSEPQQRENTRYSIAFSLMRQGKYEEALEEYKRFVEHHPDVVSVWNNMAACAMNLGRKPESLDYLRKAVDLNPDYYMGWANLARTLNEQGEHEQAREAARHAFRLDPGFATSLFMNRQRSRSAVSGQSGPDDRLPQRPLVLDRPQLQKRLDWGRFQSLAELPTTGTARLFAIALTAGQPGSEAPSLESLKPYLHEALEEGPLGRIAALVAARVLARAGLRDTAAMLFDTTQAADVDSKDEEILRAYTQAVLRDVAGEDLDASLSWMERIVRSVPRGEERDPYAKLAASFSARIANESATIPAARNAFALCRLVPKSRGQAATVVRTMEEITGPYMRHPCAGDLLPELEEAALGVQHNKQRAVAKALVAIAAARNGDVDRARRMRPSHAESREDREVLSLLVLLEIALGEKETAHDRLKVLATQTWETVERLETLSTFAGLEDDDEARFMHRLLIQFEAGELGLDSQVVDASRILTQASGLLEDPRWFDAVYDVAVRMPEESARMRIVLRLIETAHVRWPDRAQAAWDLLEGLLEAASLEASAEMLRDTIAFLTTLVVRSRDKQAQELLLDVLTKRVLDAEEAAVHVLMIAAISQEASRFLHPVAPLSAQ